jgi:hypothetical protein
MACREETTMSRAATLLAVLCAVVTFCGCGGGGSEGKAVSAAGKPPPPPPTHVRYTLTDLGTGREEWAMNENRQMAGQTTGTGTSQATFYDVNTGQQTVLDENPASAGRAISSNGLQVAGGDDTLYQAVFWERSTTTGLWTMVLLDAAVGWSAAYGMNDNCKVVGGANDVFGDPWRACIWVRDGTGSWVRTQLDEDSSKAYDINNSGLIVGEKASVATWWDGPGGGHTLLGSSDTARQVNENGQILGMGRVWMSTTSPPISLPALGANYTGILAYGMNDRTPLQVVGRSSSSPYPSDRRAVLWEYSAGTNTFTVYDLNTLVDLPKGQRWDLRAAKEIDNLGRIVVAATLGDVSHSVLLTPKS